ncbi:MAG: DNA polymerase III subunit gamma/tau [Streptococcaceae bacterium]|jgi:DNA polymerase-3 subunit gamma/tau|nr:DNA polymerase III subunit gamma/tau [Streptococcaceae bacterium]
MAYQALYRKYRSQTFSEMVGQEVVATTLKNAIMNAQISHAYLFSGPRGTGKTSAARIFAKAINCLNPACGEPDNTCEICEAINHGALDDIIELDAASNNGVDEIREIIDKSAYAATRATYKVYIIDEVHMLTTAAFNALLKVLEEPTENVVFVLATTELQKVPATIISRVQRFAFKAITTADIRAHLADVLAAENVNYDAAALDVLAKSAEGGMRDALSLLDQALSFSDGKLLKEKDALLVTGSIADAALVAYVAALAAFDSLSALTELQKIFDEGKNMLRFAEDLMAHFRDLLLSADSKIPHAVLYRWIDIVIDSLRVLRETTQTKIAADIMTMRLAEPLDARAADLTARPMKMPVPEIASKQVEMPRPKVASTPAQMPPVQTSTIPAAMPKAAIMETAAPVFSNAALFAVLRHATRADKNAVVASWNDIVADVASIRDRAVIGEANPQAASNTGLIVTLENENLVTHVTSHPELIETMQNTLSALTGREFDIFVISDAAWRTLRQDFVAQREIAPRATETVTPQATEKAPIVETSEEIAPELSLEIEEAPLPEEISAPEPLDVLSAAKGLFGDLAHEK